MIYRGIVVKQVGGKFSIMTDKEIIHIHARGNLRNNGIFVGDEIETDGQVILRVKNRRNSLKRPSIANIDQIIIVISKVPLPDFILLDKLIMYANKNNIKPIICVNKIDISEELYNDVVSQYEDVVYKIVKTSAMNNNVHELLPYLENKISVFAGQSAVGKSTLLNKILNDEIAKTGELSKIERGKNTTRETMLYCLDKHTFIADTPGFSCLDIDGDMTPEEVSSGYTEFYKLSTDCKYRQCDHINVDKCDCKVLREIENNKKLVTRYERYKDLYTKTKENWRNRYGKKINSNSKYTSGKR